MPAGVATDVTWTLPGTDGLAGYVLSTDGAGNLTFAAPPNPAQAVRTYEIDYESTTAYKFTGPGLAEKESRATFEAFEVPRLSPALSAQQTSGILNPVLTSGNNLIPIGVETEDTDGEETTAKYYRR